MARGSRLRSLGAAALLALVLLVACRQITLHGGYSPHPGYRAQVEALLDGRLALTTSPDGLRHDLAWTPRGVQQVWGLGVPLWQLPFEALGRALGFAPVPDRVALSAWLALMLYVVIRAFRPRGLVEPPPLPGAGHQPTSRPPVGARLTQIGSVMITALLPGFVAVLHGRIGVYEEAAIYAYAAALILLGGLYALTRRPTTARYLLLVAAAGLTGLIRPTVWFYGLATAAIATAIVVQLRGRHAVRAVALGAALFVAGGGVLYATNAVRFGRGTEFGHRLNVEGLPGNIVATRFSYPFERVGTIEAATELVGSLFDRPELRSKKGFYQTGLHHGQSTLPRWREYYFTTFSWGYLPVIAAGLALGALAWRRRGDRLARVLVSWAVIGGGPLFVFYLHAPSMSSRYQLDLAPAIAAVLVIAWRAAAARWPRGGFAVLVVAWGAAIATSKVTRPPAVSDPIGRDAAAVAAYDITHAVAADHPLPTVYDDDDPLLPTWTDVIEDYVACRDAAGTRIGCGSPPMPGDTMVRGLQQGQRWFVERYVVPDQPPEPACQFPGDGPAGRLLDNPAGRLADDGPVCLAPPTVRTAPGAVSGLAYVGPPTLYLNGSGWDLASSRVAPAAMFYVRDPAYLALDVTGPPGTDWERAVRVAIGLDHLPLIAVAETAHGARLRFEGGPHPGLQIAFVAFGPDSELDRPLSAFGLRSIRWRDP